MKPSLHVSLTQTLSRRERVQTNACANSPLSVFPCPCGGNDYATCCGRYHDGLPAPDPEALMRSRYSAYVKKLEPYLLATWHPDTRPAGLDLEKETTKWLGLDVKNHTRQSDDRATVEFVARYKINGRAHRLHEVSRFVLEEGLWFYLDGSFPA